VTNIPITHFSIIMSELKAVLFDLDGVLVDSHFLHYRSWQKLADELDLNFNEKMGDAYRGMDRTECLIKMFRDFNNIPAPTASKLFELTERKNNYYLEILDKASPEDLVLPGAVELLNSLQKESIKAVIASGSKNARKVVEHAGFGDLLFAIVDRHDIQKTKPDPEIFKTALEVAGVPKKNAVGVEDALLGVDSIRGAGLKSIGVGHYADTADLHVDDIKDLTVDMMRELLET